MFGRLTFEAFRHGFVQVVGELMMIIPAILIVGLLFYYKKWKWLYREWLTTLDPKKIGIKYLVVSTLMLLKGFADVMLMRIQQAQAVGDAQGILTADHFQQIFTAHGTTMIFFVGMGFLFAFMNLVVPLQIGARDVAYPFLNSVGFWLFAVGSSFIVVSMIIGDFSTGGWVGYPPLTGLKYSPNEGVDYWIWSLQIAGVGSLISGINFLATIIKMRCPGMTLMKMPIFIWCSLGTMVLILFAFPILTATLGMLSLDRLLGMHFFTPELGGNPMMYINLIWAWGHPEVYILILPAFGIFSEVVATFSHKRLFGYPSMVWAIILIVVLSFIVWLHHFFTMGAGANVNAFFGIMTMLIAIPTGVKIFNWLFTMYQGRIRFKTPMMWFIGFLISFTTGGLTGVLMSIAPVDFQTHNSLFLVAHFHSMVIGGVLFGFFSGVSYWFPKVTGFRLNERLGQVAAIFWIIGFLFAFMPLYVLGLKGATRRLDHYPDLPGWHPLFVIAAIGATLIFVGVAFQLLQLVVSIMNREELKDTTGDPWDARTLEWSIPSPPREYNFAILPQVHTKDAFWEMKQHGIPRVTQYEDIYIPKNTPLGALVGLSAFCVGFGLVWHMFWLALLGVIGIIVCMIVRLSEKEIEHRLTAAEVERMETMS